MLLCYFSGFQWLLKMILRSIFVLCCLQTTVLGEFFFNILFPFSKDIDMFYWVERKVWHLIAKILSLCLAMMKIFGYMVSQYLENSLMKIEWRKNVCPSVRGLISIFKSGDYVENPGDCAVDTLVRLSTNLKFDNTRNIMLSVDVYNIFIRCDMIWYDSNALGS